MGESVCGASLRHFPSLSCLSSWLSHLQPGAGEVLLLHFPCLEEEHFPCSPTHSVIAQLLPALCSPCLEPLGCHLLLVCLSVFPQRPGASEGFAGVQGPLKSSRLSGHKDQSKDFHEVIPTV